jgi:cytochrome c peroxidase
LLLSKSNHENKTFSLATSSVLFSCSNQDDDYVNLPLGAFKFSDLAYDISNPPTEKVLNLVKTIYDGRLASDGLVSCGFCHLQENAFTHHGHTVSHGVIMP